MVLDPHRWLELRRFRALYESGAMSQRQIAKETGLNRRTVAKYLSGEVPAAPPQRESGALPRQRAVDEVAPLIDAMLRSEILLKGAVIHERLAQEYGFAINYQRVKIYLQEARPRIAGELGINPGELAGLHRRFEVVPGAQAQVDWGDEGRILAHVGIPKVYSFHMTLSYSRDPFCCFTTSQDLATFFDCHRQAFAHFGGVPMSIVYDRTKTVVRRHVAPGEAVPLHPEAVAFAGHYDFDIDVLAAYRPQGKGRVERQVAIVRDHVLAGRAFSSTEELDAAFTAWVPVRRARVHGTHGEVIGLRAIRDHVALRPLPRAPYVVAQRHLRHVGKDCLVAFDANLYSVPARKVRPRQLVEVRVTKFQVILHSTVPDTTGGTLLAVHSRAVGRGARIVDERHWDGLPTGEGRRTTTGDDPRPRRGLALREEDGPLRALLSRAAAARVEVGRRPLSVYDELTGTRPFTTHPSAEEPC
ncbi:IS21 family transposase [Streptacidiphilus sp. P02-A3a]|uniref:IS21 family transposase n=2 Tax=Streptacidiphilus sp. P02-A3a TaxID=2704468 RepID=UPI0015F9A9A7|nr:IS21 family transposase [Streptacidiphilus sp. P02-A3a]QMU67256.1 IS21 family transposase [Streptacidiphilus sp. P02-A3a]QMU68361.1 IS21 family transposase [Streptacidiphilus sp. P02-A3a]QMU69695.1 IS21 family transposase [Streptacidiphilus sp. P02-A3a]QMU72867.1 IS21 family transposase [Streptacidiphilus sp. P02-A3a]QMU73459.1 IS21 family transposase [Streptacidiphilus sp. P02-A3a]